jgi:hypothetical protein
VTDWLFPEPDGIPDLLRQCARWLLWNGSADGKKVPYAAGDLRRAVDPNNPVNWCRFEEATAAFIRHSVSGLGFALGRTAEGLVLSGVDLDQCRDPHTGVIEEWARAIIQHFDSYTELSPSGTGVKIFTTGALPVGVPQGKRYRIEIYDQRRYFAVTGHHLPGTPRTVEARAPQLRALYERAWSRDLLDLVRLFGLYLRNDSSWVYITCPWAHEHSGHNGERDAGLHLTDGRVDGFKCFHGHCANRALPDVLALFGLHERARSDGRTLRFRLASDITPEAVSWLWLHYVPLGALSLLAGREGVGKSTLVLAVTADITRGQLRGEMFGTPRRVIIIAPEDSWAHTIVPRLIAADADLSMVMHVEVEKPGYTEEIQLPIDIVELEKLIVQQDVVLTLLDPVISRLEKSIDTHKDGDVRRALEPLAQLAQRTCTSVWGLIHVNKNASTDSLNSVMGSRAFVAVPRTVFFIVEDPDAEEEGVYLFGHAKNNLGAKQRAVKFTIEKVALGRDANGRDIETGRLKWGRETERTIRQVVESHAAEKADRHGATVAASEWLSNFLDQRDGWEWKSVIESKAMCSASALQRARKGLQVGHRAEGERGQTIWWLPGREPKPLIVKSRPLDADGSVVSVQ